MARVVSNSRICSEQQSSFSNKDFMANYRRELRIGIDIRKKEKVEKATEFTEKIRKVQEKSRTILRKVQKKIKRQTNRRQRKVEE